jgi:hypothetical protein
MQRMKMRQGKLAPDKVAVLDALDFSWGLHAGWDERYRCFPASLDRVHHTLSASAATARANPPGKLRSYPPSFSMLFRPIS